LVISPSPHSLYATSKDVIREIFDKNGESKQTCLHWLESMDELEFLKTHKGNMDGLLHRLWPEISLQYGSSLMDIQTFMENYFRTSTTLIHSVVADTKMIQNYKETGTKVVLCPRSNRTISGGYPLIEYFVDCDVPFALGTDSLGSVDDLDLRKEVSLIKKIYPSVESHILIKSLTINGAKALGIDDKFGSLESGKISKLLWLDTPNNLNCSIEDFIVENIENLKPIIIE
jgi:cytosine/adenosine deaminase-related metal-dependent hydrolase